MKVFHLCNGNMFGGIETFLVTLARLEKTSTALENRFLLSHRGRLSTELESAGSAPIVVEGARLRNPWSVLRARRACRARVREFAPDVVIAHGPWTYVVFGSGLPDHAPLVFYQHGAAEPDVLHALASRRRPAAVIANSPFTASTTPRLFPGLPVQICRYPVDPPSPKSSRDVTRAELGTGAEPVILQTSRLEPWKGQRLLLEALSRIKHLPWRLWLAGGQTRPTEANYRRELETVSRELGIGERITFLGERTDISDLLVAADVFCQPNIEREPYGITVVEAMNAGLPIVATDLGATADAIEPEIGRRVSADPQALSEALAELLADEGKRRRLGRAARRHFELNFSPAKALGALRDALGGISGPSAEGRQWA